MSDRSKQSTLVDDSAIDTAEFPAFKKARPQSISSRTTVDVSALSDRGKVRPSNQDSYLVSCFLRSIQTVFTNIPIGQLTDLHSEVGYGMLIADGVGGASGGEVASRTAISALVDLVIQTPDWILQGGEDRTTRVLERMRDRFERLGEALEETESVDPTLIGMGTTMTLAASLGSDLIIAHVGDSRAYLFTHGQLVHLTKDHTVAQMLADMGVIGPEEVNRHHARHVLTGAITAAGKKAEVELHHFLLADGDQLLLCSDGLTEMVSDDRIAAVLKANNTADESCRTLVNLALENGGKDNVTVIVARYRLPSDCA